MCAYYLILYIVNTQWTVKSWVKFDSFITLKIVIDWLFSVSCQLKILIIPQRFMANLEDVDNIGYVLYSVIWAMG